MKIFIGNRNHVGSLFALTCVCDSLNVFIMMDDG